MFFDFPFTSKKIPKRTLKIGKGNYAGSNTVFTEEMLKEGVLELTDNSTKEKLVYGTDYVIAGYKNNGRKGTATATVTVKGIGSYGGTGDVK